MINPQMPIPIPSIASSSNTLRVGSNDGGGGNVMGVRSEAWSTGRSREVLRLTGARSLGARTEDATLAKARARSHGELANP